MPGCAHGFSQNLKGDHPKLLKEEEGGSKNNNFTDAYRQIGRFIEDVCMTKCIHSGISDAGCV